MERLDILINAFNSMSDKKLKIVWVWAYEKQYKSMCEWENIEFLWYKSWDELTEIVSKSKWFLFVSNDDFWIAPVEALACSTPVLALAKWWALETNVAWVTWEFFEDENGSDFIKNFRIFEENIDLGKYKKQDLIDQAKKFSKDRFIDEIKKICEK